MPRADARDLVRGEMALARAELRVELSRHKGVAGAGLWAWRRYRGSSTPFARWTGPGTGTPGYWANHPEAWPVDVITVGGIAYTKQQAIDLLNQGGKDKRMTMFSSLVPAMLNVMIGNDPSCVQSTIDAADQWMATYWPLGSVHAASYAWKVGEPLHRQMDNYNNGMLCAPHRE
jgi:hypothetical protein